MGRLVDLESAREIPGERFPLARWSPLLSNTHPEYFRCWFRARWKATGGAAAAVSFLFFAALIAMVTGGLAFSRGPLAGLVADLRWQAQEPCCTKCPRNYADIPLATYLAGALIFILVDRPAFAGVLAGFAVWTKDEGALFCLAILALVAAFRRRDLVRLFLGMLPGALIYAGFKNISCSARIGPFRPRMVRTICRSA